MIRDYLDWVLTNHNGLAHINKKSKFPNDENIVMNMQYYYMNDDCLLQKEICERPR